MEEYTRLSSMSFSRKMHFSEECLARGWTVTDPTRILVGGWHAARVAVQGVRGVWCNVARFQLSPPATDTFTPVCVGQGLALELISWRSTFAFQHTALSM